MSLGRPRRPRDGAAQLVHHRAAPAEVVVQRGVVAVQLVVAIRGGGVGQVAVAAHLAHRGRRGADVVVAAGGDGGVDRRAERRPFVRVDHVQRPPEHVRVDLHQQRVLDQPAGDGELAHGQARRLEGLDDRAGAERGRLDQRAVDVLRARAERQPDDGAAELVVDEHGAVAAVPVERDEPVRAGRLGGRELGQVLVRVETAASPPRRGSAPGAAAPRTRRRCRRRRSGRPRSRAGRA